MAIDTLQLSKDLQGVEFTRDQAEVLARIFLEQTNGELEEKLRGDISKLEQRFSKLEQRFSGLEQRFSGLEQRLETIQSCLDDLREAMKRGFQDIRVELMAEIKAGDASSKLDLAKWVVGAIVLNLVGTAGLMITLIRTAPH